jgi:hypothetical protein
VSFARGFGYRIASYGFTCQAPSQANAQKEAQEDASPHPSSTQQIARLRLAPFLRVINATNSSAAPRAVSTRHQRNK